MTQPRRPDEGASVAVLIPLRQLQDGERPVVVRRVGRPRRVESAPTVDEQVYLDAVAAEVHRAVEQDELVVATHAENPKTVLQKTMTAVAGEAAALRWERERAQREGKPEAERISTRRTNALLRLAELAILHAQLRADDLEPDPADVAVIIGMLLHEVEETVAVAIPAEVGARFVERLKKKIAASGLPCGTVPR